MPVTMRAHELFAPLKKCIGQSLKLLGIF